MSDAAAKEAVRAMFENSLAELSGGDASVSASIHADDKTTIQVEPLMLADRGLVVRFGRTARGTMHVFLTPAAARRLHDLIGEKLT